MHLHGLPNLVKQAGMTTTRYPGGILSDSFHFRDWLLPTVAEWITQPNEFITYAQQSQTKPVITVNFGSGSALEAADFVDYMALENNLDTALWEVGNEIYGSWTPSWTNDGLEYMNGDTSHDGANDFCTQMKQVTPSINVGMVGTSSEPEQNQFAKKALQAASTCFDTYIFHYYPLGQNQSSYYTLLNSPHADISLIVNNINNMISQYFSGTHLDLAMTEYNGFWSNPPHIASEMANALFLGDVLGQSAVAGVDMANHWFIGGTPSNSGYDLLHNYPNYSTTPNYYVFPIMSALTGQLHRVTSDLDSTQTSVYASTDSNGTTHIIVINKTDKTVSTDLQLSGTVSASSASVHELSGSALNTSSVSFNGVTSPADLSTVPSISTAISSNSISYAIKPYSITRFSIAP